MVLKDEAISLRPHFDQVKKVEREGQKRERRNARRQILKSKKRIKDDRNGHLALPSAERERRDLALEQFAGC